MKIWTANLYFGYDLNKELSMNFIFRKEDREDYKIKIEESYGEAIVTQGFDRELTEQEQNEIKENMIDCLIKYLENKQKYINKIFNEKLIFLNK